jgi:hypothetical protein
MLMRRKRLFMGRNCSVASNYCTIWSWIPLYWCDSIIEYLWAIFKASPSFNTPTPWAQTEGVTDMFRWNGSSDWWNQRVWSQNSKLSYVGISRMSILEFIDMRCRVIIIDTDYKSGYEPLCWWSKSRQTPGCSQSIIMTHSFVIMTDIESIILWSILKLNKTVSHHVIRDLNLLRTWCMLRQYLAKETRKGEKTRRQYQVPLERWDYGPSLAVVAYHV